MRGAGTSAEQLGGLDIANLLQEALEEEEPGRRLTRVTAALGLLMGALHCSPRK
jgi:hypothetical protein